MSTRTVWIVCAYGGLPAEGHRDFRCFLLGKELASRGYGVIWWVSSFDHTRKQQRVEVPTETGVAGFQIRLVRTTGYRSNVSFRRIWSEWRFGRVLERQVLGENDPSAIVLIDPARFYGNAVVRLARQTGSRLLLDVMDLWPELFELVLPRTLRPIGKALMMPLYVQRNWLARQASALVGVATDYVDTVGDGAGFKGPRHTTYLGCHGSVETDVAVPAEVRTAISREPSTKIVVYAGTLGDNYDIDALIGAFRLARGRPDIRWVIAGAGPRQDDIAAAAAELGPATVRYVGLQKASVIAWLLRQSDIGLSCYHEASTVSMPFKAFDYMAAGLPIVNSLGRELGHLVRTSGIGVQYEAGNSQGLYAAVQRLCDDEALRTACRQASGRAAKGFETVSQYRSYVDFMERTVLSGQS